MRDVGDQSETHMQDVERDVGVEKQSAGCFGVGFRHDGDFRFHDEDLHADDVLGLLCRRDCSSSGAGNRRRRRRPSRRWSISLISLQKPTDR